MKVEKIAENPDRPRRRRAVGKPRALVVCVNRRFGLERPSCGESGSIAIAEALEREIERRRIDIRVEHLECLGQCASGPSMRIVPAGRFFLEVTLDDVTEIVDILEKACGAGPESAGDEGPPAHLVGS
jgi:(2Fe-2S) ferredoxin